MLERPDARTGPVPHSALSVTNISPPPFRIAVRTIRVGPQLGCRLGFLIFTQVVPSGV
jgi:hypothetical protein